MSDQVLHDLQVGDLIYRIPQSVIDGIRGSLVGWSARAATPIQTVAVQEEPTVETPPAGDQNPVPETPTDPVEQPPTGDPVETPVDAPPTDPVVEEPTGAPTP